MNGVPCLRGLRIPVATVVGMIADGMTAREISEAYILTSKQQISQNRRDIPPKRFVKRVFLLSDNRMLENSSSVSYGFEIIKGSV
jgi:hypothetical protein